MKHTSAFCILLGVLMQPFILTGQPARTGASKAIDSTAKKSIAQWMGNDGRISFLENKGQMADINGDPVKGLLFRASGSGADMYVTTHGLSYVFTRKKTLKSKKVDKFGQRQDSITGQYCRADMELAGADIRKENIVKEGESKDFKNYYLGKICPSGILNVHSYQRITIKNIYPGIDWVLYTNASRTSANDGELSTNDTPPPFGGGWVGVDTPSPIGEGRERVDGIEYDFIVHPGADPSLIKLRYKWADEPQLQDDGSLKIKLPLGSITE
jgi:hypothetical protein